MIAFITHAINWAAVTSAFFAGMFTAVAVFIVLFFAIIATHEAYWRARHGEKNKTPETSTSPAPAPPPYHIGRPRLVIHSAPADPKIAEDIRRRSAAAFIGVIKGVKPKGETTEITWYDGTKTVVEVASVRPREVS